MPLGAAAKQRGWKVIPNTKRKRRCIGIALEAEDEGFEPPIPFSILRFECSAFNRSANPPLKFAYQRNPVTQGKHYLLYPGISGFLGGGSSNNAGGGLGNILGGLGKLFGGK